MTDAANAREKARYSGLLLEINFNKYFYKYEPPREPAVIAAEIVALEEETSKMMKGLFS